MTNRPVILYLVFFLSGIAGLGYEIVWTRMFAVGLGHEIVSILAVISAFFGGLAAGAWGLDRLVSASRMPGRWYAFLELVIGLWSVFTIVLIPWANDQIAYLTGPLPGAARHWSVAFLVPFLSLFPATAAMGATLPAMDRLVARLRQEGRLVGGLYGINTLGALAGTVLVTFVVIPQAGLTASIVLLATLNVICAAAVVFGLARSDGTLADTLARLEGGPGRLRLGATLCLTGLLGIGYEVLAIRTLAQVLENTVYTFAAVLGVYLLGTTVGAAAYQLRRPRRAARAVLTSLLQATSTACILGLFVLPYSKAIYDGVRGALGGGFAAVACAEMALAGLVLIVPAGVMGALFCHLAQTARGVRGGVGWALGINTLGGAVAPFVFGVLVFPLVGEKTALVSVALAYLALIPEARPRQLAPAALPLALLLYLPSNLAHVDVPPYGRIIEYRSGVMAAVAVVEDSTGERLLQVNNRYRMGGSRSTFGSSRLGHIPLLMHPDPRRALYLGVGTGITCAAASFHKEIETECVELVPEVVDMLPIFHRVNAGLGRRANPAVHIADARRYVRATTKRYDVIVADLFHPARDGAGALYTREHFLAIRDRLAPGGQFTQWLTLFQLKFSVLRVIVRTFLDVFPEARAHLVLYNVHQPVIGLVGSVTPRRYPTDTIERRRDGKFLRAALRRYHLDSTVALLGGLLGGPEALARFAAAAPLNTDDRPVVAFEAPFRLIAEAELGPANLTALLRKFKPGVNGLLAPSTEGSDKGFAERLVRYQDARNLYIQGELNRATGRNAEAQRLYLDSLRTSREFDPSYEILLWLVRSRVKVDPQGARALLETLASIDPSRREVRKLLGILERNR